MLNSQRILSLTAQHEAWRTDNFLNKKGFYPVFSGFKKYFGLLSPGAITLFLYLGLHSNNISGQSHHSIKTMAKNLNKSERTVSNWISELEEIGLIERLQPNFNSVSHTFIIPYDESNN